MIAFWGGLASIINRSTEVATKYISLNQFNNSEVDSQMLHAAGNITYLNYSILVTFLFALAAIWKPKQTQTKNQ